MLQTVNIEKGVDRRGSHAALMAMTLKLFPGVGFVMPSFVRREVDLVPVVGVVEARGEEREDWIAVEVQGGGKL